MEWTDANGAVYTGQTLIPAGAVDTTGGALPGGSVRWRNVGSFEAQWFDLLATVPTQPTLYSELITVSYISPVASSVRQALSFGGFACLGLGIAPSTCESGASLKQGTATCTDRTPTTMYGGEFEISAFTDSPPVKSTFGERKNKMLEVGNHWAFTTAEAVAAPASE